MTVVGAFVSHTPFCRPTGLKPTFRFCGIRDGTRLQPARNRSQPPVRLSLELTNTAGALEETRRVPKARDKGTLLLCMICVVGYIVDHIAHLPISWLYLHTAKWAPHQLVTSLFCHASFDHLSSNLFPLLVFGRFVEEEAGALGIILAFLVCGACANIASILLLGGAGVVSLGASGSVFSLFSLAVLVRFRFTIGRLVEAFILSTHVASRFRNEIMQAARGGGIGPIRVNHVAHIAGALCGVLLVILLNMIVRRFDPPTSKSGQIDRNTFS